MSTTNFIMAVIGGWLAFAMAGDAAADVVPPVNVLLIVSDDQNCRLGCYGDAEMKTPHIDALAARGLTLRRAYCQFALCNPSRTSFLTGLRPDTTGVVDNGGHFRDAKPEAMTLPQYFREHGYVTQALGKIFHPGREDEKSWSAGNWQPTKPSYGPEGLALIERQKAEFAERERAAGKKPPKHVFGPAYEATDAADDELSDGETAAKAVQTLRELAQREASAPPFFLAIGFLRPHLPLVAPRRFFDLYPPESVRLASHARPPRDVPDCAMYDSTELRQQFGMPRSGPFSEDEARELVRAYAASTSFLDAQVGRVLAELDRTKLAERTVVVFLGDHGWHLGEHGIWGKHTNFEAATHAPLIVAPPRPSLSATANGRASDALVEFVDLYPTLAELCGLPAPANLDGLSFAPLFADPARQHKSAVFHQYARLSKGKVAAMGHAVRTERYRYVEWTSPGGELLGRELYDYATDPDETSNLAVRTEHAAKLEKLRALLKKR